MSVRHTVCVLGAAVGVGAGVLALAPAAVAAPYVISASISVSASCPPEGATIVITGRGWAAGEIVETELASGRDLANARADAVGNFSARVPLPAGVTGTQTIMAEGRTSESAASAIVAIAACQASAPGGGNLPKTGAQVAAVALAGALLVGGGVTLVRRRRVDA